MKKMKLCICKQTLSRSHKVKKGPIILYDAESQMTVLAKVEKNRASRSKLDGKV